MTTDTQYHICPMCHHNSLIYYAKQLDQNYRPIGIVYQCTICKAQLCITERDYSEYYKLDELK